MAKETASNPVHLFTSIIPVDINTDRTYNAGTLEVISESPRGTKKSDMEGWKKELTLVKSYCEAGRKAILGDPKDDTNLYKPFLVFVERVVSEMPEAGKNIKVKGDGIAQTINDEHLLSNSALTLITEIANGKIGTKVAGKGEPSKVKGLSAGNVGSTYIAKGGNEFQDVFTKTVAISDTKDKVFSTMQTFLGDALYAALVGDFAKATELCASQNRFTKDKYNCEVPMGFFLQLVQAGMYARFISVAQRQLSAAQNIWDNRITARKEGSKVETALAATN